VILGVSASMQVWPMAPLKPLTYPRLVLEILYDKKHLPNHFIVIFILVFSELVQFIFFRRMKFYGCGVHINHSIPRYNYNLIHARNQLHITFADMRSCPKGNEGIEPHSRWSMPLIPLG
jgi:hypothetical protein